MEFLGFSDWLLVRESRGSKLKGIKKAKRKSSAKNTAIDMFLKSVEQLEKDVEELSKKNRSSLEKTKRDDKISDDKKDQPERDDKKAHLEKKEENDDSESDDSEDEEKEVD